MSLDARDLIFEPERYSEIPAARLFEAASRGYLGVDHRFLHALLDDPERSISDLLRFASEDHAQDQVVLDEVLVDMFRYLRTPKALPFYIEQIRLNPSDVSDDLVESVVELGAPAMEPLLALLDELKEPGDLPFMLAALRIRDPRILGALERGIESDAVSGALSLEIYGDPAGISAIEAALARVPNDDVHDRKIVQTAIDILKLPPPESSEAPKQFDIWDKYPEEEFPPLEILSDDDRLILLERGSAAMRAEVVASYNGSEPPLLVRAKILDLAKNDPEPSVRGAGWEALSEVSDEPELRRAMLEVLRNPGASVEEKGGAAIALAERSDNAAVFQAIEALYENQSSRAQALKAMARSLDRRFSAYPPRHLADSDIEVKRQAIWGVGYLRLSSEAPRLEALFDEEEFRRDALFAYALASPGETSPGRAPALLNKVDQLAGGLVPDEAELVKIAIDQRLMLAGHKAAFFGDETSEEPEAKPTSSEKTGRNDPCPCGSGKKFKKCCGA
jgi:SEC-C motif